MFVITQGLLSPLDVTQGYGAAAVVPVVGGNNNYNPAWRRPRPVKPKLKDEEDDDAVAIMLLWN